MTSQLPPAIPSINREAASTRTMQVIECEKSYPQNEQQKQVFEQRRSIKRLLKGIRYDTHFLDVQSNNEIT